jgi:hypothetical protein
MEVIDCPYFQCPKCFAHYNAIYHTEDNTVTFTHVQEDSCENTGNVITRSLDEFKKNL